MWGGTSRGSLGLFRPITANTQKAFFKAFFLERLGAPGGALKAFPKTIKQAELTLGICFIFSPASPAFVPISSFLWDNL
jgi:hypothetical protein